jgi:hypothetical protein
MLGRMGESDVQFVDRMVGGLVGDLDDDGQYRALNRGERQATLVWVALGLVAADGWSGWAASLGRRTGDLVEALRAMGAAELADVAEQLGALDPQVDADLERRWFALVRTTDPVESHLAPWIRRHPTELPSTVDDL